MTPSQSLRIVLRITAILSGLAAIAVYMPRSWMVFSHEGVGLGAFPEGPITEYLARSASGLYAIFGGLLWVLSQDVARYRPAIRYFAVAMLAFGCTMVGVDVHIGMPAWWILLEGPSAVALGIVVLILQGRGAGRSDNRPEHFEACHLSDVR